MSKSAARGAKNVIVKLIVGAGQASPSPPVGPALGSKGVKSMDFCKEFNALTAHITPGTPVPAIVTVRPDRSFTFSLRTPPTASLLLRAAGVKPSKGQKFRGANAVGRAPAELVNSESSTGLPADVRGSVAATTNQAATANPGATAADASGAEQGATPTSTSEIGQGVVRMVAKAAGGDKQPGHGGGSTQVGEISLKHVYEIAKIKQTEARLSGLSLEGLCKSVVAQARSIGVGIVP